jgi:hypothetical protein
LAKVLVQAIATFLKAEGFIFD